jgi:hypothetical protein
MNTQAVPTDLALHGAIMPFPIVRRRSLSRERVGQAPDLAVDESDRQFLAGCIDQPGQNEFIGYFGHGFLRLLG